MRLGLFAILSALDIKVHKQGFHRLSCLLKGWQRMMAIVPLGNAIVPSKKYKV